VPESKIVLSRRGDGLGERLNSLLNAMRLAEILDVDFRFTWPIGAVGKDPHHAIVPPEQFFSADFVAAHLMTTADTRGGFARLAGPAGDLDSLRRQLDAVDRGLIAPGRPLRTRIDPEAVPAVTRGFSAEFDAVGFHPSIEAVIAAARAVPLSAPTVGVHLRSGDLLFGRYRYWTAYWYKIVPIPVARALIERFQTDGREVVVFGEDTRAIGDLCATTGASEASTRRSSPDMTPAETAMFDLVLLSRCDRIIGGWSGFAIQAASISDQGVEHHLDLIAPSDVVDLTKADIALHGDRYDPTHRSFAWWAAYYGARDELPYDESVDLLTSAIAADPTNPRARLRLAGLSYREGHLERGDDALVDALTADVATGGTTLESVMLFSLMTVRGYDSADILDDIERGAREGSGPALIYRAALRAQRGDAVGAQADAAAFVSYAVGDRRLAGLPDLDRLATATIDERLDRAGQTGQGRSRPRSS
jgi:hypothetical protein